MPKLFSPVFYKRDDFDPYGEEARTNPQLI